MRKFIIALFVSVMAGIMLGCWNIWNECGRPTLEVSTTNDGQITVGMSFKF